MTRSACHGTSEVNPEIDTAGHSPEAQMQASKPGGRMGSLEVLLVVVAGDRTRWRAETFCL
ncbi:MULTISPECIES: hypothetical protein [unclassified Mesorhizobium]|uniref:hypothetical protein n=1 Tax=unclassified Mesorhizobium TaxID=325217 RepID=UPI0011294A66|nr:MULTISPECIES: hypothetical protein [unclassified Mesorhizobium]TPK92352.1 hypothetical protein FJ548_00170 [Mesorhizobium sp. B2-4-17]TPL03584.1 hypothetical protein FJ938_17440 [Mesorhizobium sp. B2-4-14]